MGTRSTKNEHNSNAGMPPEGSSVSPAKTNRRFALLGIGCSGKATMMQQLRILYGGEFTDEEKEVYKKGLISNLLVTFRELVKQARKMCITIESEEAAMIFSSVDPYKTHLSSDLVNLINTLWSDKGIQAVYGKRNSFDLPTNTEYIMNIIDKLADPQHQISAEDALRVRIRTAGIAQYSFKVRSKMDWYFVDPGPGCHRKYDHRSTRWYENVTCFIFVAALDEWDGADTWEDNLNKTRLQASLDMFDSMVNYDYFADKKWVLILNKKDSFEQKIKTVDLSLTFPDYINKGGSDNEQGVKYMTELFRARIRLLAPMSVHVHVTSAFDREQIQEVFEKIAESAMHSPYKGKK